MADKRTDKDDNVKEDRSWQFIQEKIVRQPLSRRQIVRYIILTVICAVLFGTISAVCFTVTKTVVRKIMGQEKIEESVLYNVKKIMQEAYDENYPLEESKLKAGVLDFFISKKTFLSNLKVKYGSDFAGSLVVPEIYQDFEAITKTSDALTIFNEIIKRKEHLIDKAEVLEQLEGFYKEGSNQQKVYKDAVDILDWYSKNVMFNDLSKLQDVISEMGQIVAMEIPFSKMSDLANLVFKAGEIKQAILSEKYENTKRKLEKDLSKINQEMQEALSQDLVEEKKKQIQERGEALAHGYEDWFNSLSPMSQNMDSYITSSESAVKKYREFIAQMLVSTTDVQLKRKSVRMIEYVPIANKKVRDESDVNKVVDAIRNKLLADLKDCDEIDLG